MKINKKRFLAGVQLGVLLLLVLSGCSGSENEPVNSAAPEVESREIAFASTMEERDFDAFFTFISTEAVFFNGNEVLRGHDAIAKAWAPFFEGETAPFSWHPDMVEVLESGTLALSSGPIHGPSGEVLGRYNSIWRKDKDGQWRVIFDKGS